MAMKRSDPAGPRHRVEEAIDAAEEIRRLLDQFTGLLQSRLDQGPSVVFSEEQLKLAEDIVGARGMLRWRSTPRNVEIQSLIGLIADAAEHQAKSRKWPVTFGVLDANDHGGTIEERLLRALRVRHPGCEARLLETFQGQAALLAEIRELMIAYQSRGKRKPEGKRATSEKFWPRMSRFVAAATGTTVSPNRLRGICETKLGGFGRAPSLRDRPGPGPSVITDNDHR